MLWLFDRRLAGFGGLRRGRLCREVTDPSSVAERFEMILSGFATTLLVLGEVVKACASWRNSRMS
jgi:hypothetical protein